MAGSGGSGVYVSGYVYFRNRSSGLTAVTSHPRELDWKPAKRFHFHPHSLPCPPMPLLHKTHNNNSSSNLAKKERRTIKKNKKLCFYNQSGWNYIVAFGNRIVVRIGNGRLSEFILPPLSSFPFLLLVILLFFGVNVTAAWPFAWNYSRQNNKNQIMLIFQFREPVTWLLVSQRLESNRQLHHELSTHKFNTQFNQLASTTSRILIHFEWIPTHHLLFISTPSKL